MTIRSVPLLAAALALFAAPALAQDGTGDAQLREADVPALPAVDSPEPPTAGGAAAEPAPVPAAAPAPASEPAAAPPAAAARAILASPFSPDQRNGWLAQCRGIFLRAGAPLGGGNGLPDACETQLIDFERSYVPAADGQPPVIFVRVPVMRSAVAPASAPDADAEE